MKKKTLVFRRKARPKSEQPATAPDIEQVEVSQPQAAEPIDDNQAEPSQLSEVGTDTADSQSTVAFDAEQDSSPDVALDSPPETQPLEPLEEDVPPVSVVDVEVGEEEANAPETVSQPPSATEERAEFDQASQAEPLEVVADQNIPTEIVPPPEVAEPQAEVAEPQPKQPRRGKKPPKTQSLDEDEADPVERPRKMPYGAGKLGVDAVPFSWRHPLKINDKRVKVSRTFRTLTQQATEREHLLPTVSLDN